MNWKEQLQSEIMEEYLFLAEMKQRAKDKTAHMVEMRASWEKLCNFIESLLEEQRKENLASVYKEAFNEGRISMLLDSGLDRGMVEVHTQGVKENLINQILSEAPEDTVEVPDVLGGYYKMIGFNRANQQWRELLRLTMTKN